MGPLVRNGGGRPGDAAEILDDANVGQKRLIVATPMLHRRPDPKDVLLVIAGGQCQCKGKTLSPLATTPRTARGPNRFAGRPEYRGRWGGGDGAESPNNQPAGIRRRKNNTRLGDAWRRPARPLSLPLLLLRGPVIDQLDRGIVDDGAEANEIIGRSNNQLWGTAETEGDGCDVVLLEVADGLPRKHNNQQLLACYTTNATGGNENTSTAIKAGGWGTSGASNGQLRAIHGSNTTQNRSQMAKCYINF